MRMKHLAPAVALSLAAFTSVSQAQQPAPSTKVASAHTHRRHTVKKAETQADLEKEAKMTMADARALAEKTVPGATIQAGEIEREGGKLIYSFDMKTPGKSGIDEVNIDAMTSKVLSDKHETPKAERAEAAADAKAAKKAAKKTP
jgi:uncharacterized membrane protein YkoI